jgi:hypothetical protein
MKKTLALLVALLISVGSMAQLNITSDEKSPEFLTKNLMYNPNTNKYTLFFETSNQFDDSMQILLGNKEQAIKTLEDLTILTEIKEEKTIEINNGYGEIFRIYTGPSSTMMCGDGYAGYVIISPNILTKAKVKLTGKLPPIIDIVPNELYYTSDSLYYAQLKTEKGEMLSIELGKGKEQTLENLDLLIKFAKDSAVNDNILFNGYNVKKTNSTFVVFTKEEQNSDDMSWTRISTWKYIISRFEI